MGLRPNNFKEKQMNDERNVAIREASLLFDRGIDELEAGNLESALVHFNRSLEIKPDDGIVLLHRAICKCSILLDNATEEQKPHLSSIIFDTSQACHQLINDRTTASIGNFNNQRIRG